MMAAVDLIPVDTLTRGLLAQVLAVMVQWDAGDGAQVGGQVDVCDFAGKLEPDLASFGGCDPETGEELCGERVDGL